MTEEVKILCVDDETSVLNSLERLFLDETYTILRAVSGEEALAVLERENPVQVVVSDYRMPGMDGVELLRQVYERWPDTVRIILSGYADAASIVSAINEGRVYKFIPKPWNDDELRVTIAKAVELYSLVKENRDLNSELMAANESLAGTAVRLEEMVRERTAELLFQNRVLKHGQAILDTLPMGVLGFDDRDMLVQRNRFACTLLPGAREAALGADAREVLPRELFSFLKELQAGKTDHATIEINGAPLCIKGAMMNAEQGQSGSILVFDREDCEAK